LVEEVKALIAEYKALRGSGRAVDRFDRALSVPGSAFAALVEAVPTDVVRAIVRDARVSPMSVLRPQADPPKGGGSYEPTPLRAPDGIALVDAIGRAFERRDLVDAVMADRRRRGGGDGEAGG
jgi:hypothetical protein